MSLSGNSSQPTYAPWQFSEYTIAFEGNSVACIFSGVYFVIAGTNLYLLQQKRYRALQVYSIIQLVLTILLVTISFYTDPLESLGIFNITDASPDATSPWPAVLVNVMFVLNTWLSDAFLLYRCYVVCVGNKYALALPGFLYFATFATSISWLAVSSMPGALYSTRAVQITATSYWSCSTALNICASIIISARLLMHRQAISTAVGSQQGAFYLGYMAMTLESALLYAVFAIAVLVVFTLNSPLENVFIPVLGIVQAIAPSLIIYRIVRGISFETDEYGTITTARIEFAPSGQKHVTPRRAHPALSDGSDTLQDNDTKTAEQLSDFSIHEIKPQV